MEPFSFEKAFHVIFCRNVMIYFDKPTREKLVGKFGECLVPGGYLFVGHSESLTGIEHKLKFVRPAVYRREV
jgi:chemotaxis protein methyltransferase CheR